jgi:hypothetical protein
MYRVGQSHKFSVYNIKVTIYTSGRNRDVLMDKLDPSGKPTYEIDDDEEYDDMDLLERLETLREDMEDLGVSTLAEVVQRIKELHKQLDSR